MYLTSFELCIKENLGEESICFLVSAVVDVLQRNTMFICFNRFLRRVYSCVYCSILK